MQKIEITKQLVNGAVKIVVREFNLSEGKQELKTSYIDPSVFQVSPLSTLAVIVEHLGKLEVLK